MKILLLTLCVFQLSFKTLDAPREILKYSGDFLEFADTQQILPELQSRQNSTKFIVGNIDELSKKLGTPVYSTPTLTGVCLYEINTIILDPSFFSLSEDQKQDLIDHEMGHCVLGRVHSFKIEISKYQPDYLKPMSFLFRVTASSRMYPWASASDKSSQDLRKELFNLADQGKMKYAQAILFKRTNQVMVTTQGDQVANDMTSLETLKKIAERE